MYPPFDTPTCMWKFQSISESSQPKNWMSAVNTRKMLWCIYHVFLSFRRGRPEAIAEERNWRHSTFSWDHWDGQLECMRTLPQPHSRVGIICLSYMNMSQDVPGITKWPLLNSRTSFMPSVESAKPGLYIQRDLPSQDHLVFRQKEFSFFCLFSSENGKELLWWLLEISRLRLSLYKFNERKDRVLFYWPL